MHDLTAPFALWHDITLFYAILVGVEAPALLVLAVLNRRPGLEVLLAVAPSLVCFWALSVARAAATAYQYWQGYFAYQQAHYPQPYLLPSLDDIAPAAANITQLGWEVCAGTIVALILGWALLLRWYPRPARVAKADLVLVAASRQ
jgi:hypothetical protein